MIAAHFPILQVTLPLMAAPLCLVLGRPRLTWGVALIVSWANLAISFELLIRVLGEGVIVYEIGGWAAPWGIEYRIDTLNAFVLVIVSAIGAVVLPYARDSVEAEIPEHRIALFYTMLLLCQAGLLGITITGDAFNLFVFLEISSLSSYVLISLGSDRKALVAAYRYLVMGTIGATFYVIGVGLMYMMTGTLNIADLASLMPAVADTRTVQAAMAFLTVGLGLKLALFPLHMWLPNAYAFAPSVVTIFLAATATKVAVYALIRVVFTIFGAVDLLETFQVRDLLMGLAMAAMLAGSAIAIYQIDVKRLLAYSSIAQIGYMILGLSFDTVNGLTAGIVHLFHHALTKGALFMALGCAAFAVGSVKLDDLAGLGRRMPITSAVFVAAGFSLIGIPLTTGFAAKWILLLAAIERGWWPIAAVVVVTSLLAVVYIWRVVEVAYFRPAAAGGTEVVEAPLTLLVPMLVLIGFTYYFGINATLAVDVATDAADALLGAIR